MSYGYDQTLERQKNRLSYGKRQADAVIWLVLYVIGLGVYAGLRAYALVFYNISINDGLYEAFLNTHSTVTMLLN
tara:strand:- start:5756 stop:5980 length:225 start_codon:yes stop_codon:yes gene_type:complete